MGLRDAMRALGRDHQAMEGVQYLDRDVTMALQRQVEAYPAKLKRAESNVLANPRRPLPEDLLDAQQLAARGLTEEGCRHGGSPDTSEHHLIGLAPCLPTAVLKSCLCGWVALASCRRRLGLMVWHRS